MGTALADVPSYRGPGPAWPDLVLWAIGLVAGAFLLALGFGLAANGNRPAAPPRASEAAAPYALLHQRGSGMVRLEGRIDFGVTHGLQRLLERHPSIRRLALDSVGGRVAEARGLVRLVEDFDLTTMVVGECSSACTLVFIGGARRLLAPGARLGFHRYGQHSPLIGHFLDPAAEQERDMRLFRRHGIDEAFLARIAATPHSEMWFPTTPELLAAGIAEGVTATASVSDPD